jgi:hypothetical protein
VPRPKTGYRLADGTEVPGVTTIAGRFKNSGAIVQWAFRQGRLGLPSLYAKLDQEADIGTCVHDMVGLAFRGKGDEEIQFFAQQALPDPVDFGRAMAGFRAYRAWEQSFKVRVVDSELSLVSEKHKYGGTLDFTAVVGNELALLEIKTASGIYADHLIQGSAYKPLYEERFPERALTGGYHVIRLPKDGSSFAHHHYPWKQLRPCWRLFKLYRQAFDLAKQVEDRKFLAGARITAEPRAKRQSSKKSYPAMILPNYDVKVAVAFGNGKEGST